jgi:hypothetical protein
MKHRLETQVEIDASPEIVWDLLTDLDGYSAWNPFIVAAAGTVAVGERLANRMQPPGGKAIKFRPTVTVVETGRVFEWLGRLGFAGIFDGRHRFELSSTPSGGTRLSHTEDLSGILVRALRKSLDGATLEGFEAMNSALKSRAETCAASRS